MAYENCVVRKHRKENSLYISKIGGDTGQISFSNATEPKVMNVSQKISSIHFWQFNFHKPSIKINNFIVRLHQWFVNCFAFPVNDCYSCEFIPHGCGAHFTIQGIDLWNILSWNWKGFYKWLLFGSLTLTGSTSEVDARVRTKFLNSIISLTCTGCTWQPSDCASPLQQE